MRIPSGSTDRYIYFVAVDSTDLKTREQSLTTFTVYGSRNGGAAAVFTTPTVNETDTTNMPGVYELLLDEQTTLTAGNDTEELCLHITQASMAPVTRTVEIYRPETTEGNTLDVTATGAAGMDWGNVENQGTSVSLTSTTVATVTTTTTATNLTTNNDKTGYTLSATGVDEVWDEVITSGAHNVADSAAKYLRQLRTNGVYLSGAVFVDTLNGTAGTEDYENGTDHNPVDLIASANTIAASVGLTKFHIANGSTITFAASQAGDEFVGEAWTLALGTQSIVGCYIEGATVSGVGNGVGTTQIFEHCIVGATTVPKGTIFRECALTGTLTFGEAGDIRLVHCVSGIAGAASPTIDMGAAVGASTLELRGWAGGITLNNLATGDVVTLDGTFGTITLNGADATVEIRGSYKALTNNLTGSPTVNDAAANLQTIDANVDAILADTNELQTDDYPSTLALASVCTEARLSELDAATGGKMANQVDVIQTDTTTDIPALLPSALIGGRMDSTVSAINNNTTAAAQLALSAEQIESGQCEGTPSTTVIQTDLAETQDDIYIGRTVIFTSGNARGEATDITDYAGATGTITVTALANAPAATDTFILI